MSALEDRLKADGFAPMPARHLLPGMIVAFRATLLGAPSESGYRTAHVQRVEYDRNWGTVVVDHTQGTTEADEESPVWVLVVES